MPCAGRDFPCLFLPRQPAFSRACFSGTDFLSLPYDDRTLRLQRRGVRDCPPCGCHARGIVCLPLRGRHDPFGCRHPYGAPYRRVAAQRDGASPRRGFPLFRYRIPPNARRGALRPRMWRRRRGLRRAHPPPTGGSTCSVRLPWSPRRGRCRPPSTGRSTWRATWRRRSKRRWLPDAAGVNPSNVRQLAATGVDAVHFSARSVRPGGMVFRNPHVSMGGCGDVSEYDLLCADERLIRQILTLLEP